VALQGLRLCGVRCLPAVPSAWFESTWFEAGKRLVQLQELCLLKIQP
jgi:hypothetical protein